MHRNVARLRVIVGIVLTICLLGGAAALATHNIDHAERQISVFVEQANGDMAAVVARFALDAPTAWTQSELDGLEAAAKDELDGIRNAASRELDAIKKDYQDLGTAVQEAKFALNDSRNVFKTQLKVIADSTLPPGNTTTTSAPLNPTTTTAPSRNTTTTPPAGTATAPPSTTTTAPATTVVTNGSPPAGSATSQTSGGTLDAALEPPPGFTSAAEAPPARARGLSGTLTNGLSVVLPPTVATAVLSPLIVIEVLLGALVSSVRALVLPTLLLLVAWIAVMPRRRSRLAEDRSNSAQRTHRHESVQPG